jgi:hypothetical protein
MASPRLPRVELRAPEAQPPAVAYLPSQGAQWLDPSTDRSMVSMLTGLNGNAWAALRQFQVAFGPCSREVAVLITKCLCDWQPMSSEEFEAARDAQCERLANITRPQKVVVYMQRTIEKLRSVNAPTFVLPLVLQRNSRLFSRAGRPLGESVENRLIFFLQWMMSTSLALQRPAGVTRPVALSAENNGLASLQREIDGLNSAIAVLLSAIVERHRTAPREGVDRAGWFERIVSYPSAEFLHASKQARVTWEINERWLSNGQARFVPSFADNFADEYRCSVPDVARAVWRSIDGVRVGCEASAINGINARLSHDACLMLRDNGVFPDSVAVAAQSAPSSASTA